jgi:urease accessory protein
MTVGAGLGFGGIALPHAESGVTLSVTVLGLALWRGWHLPVWLAGTMTAGFAVFHGYVHAAEADTVGGESLAYLQGFLCTTAVLHVIGMGLGQLTRSVAPGRQLFGMYRNRTLLVVAGRLNRHRARAYPALAVPQPGLSR